jgi:hypothetical protein
MKQNDQSINPSSLDSEYDSFLAELNGNGKPKSSTSSGTGEQSSSSTTAINSNTTTTSTTSTGKPGQTILQPIIDMNLLSSVKLPQTVVHVAQPGATVAATTTATNPTIPADLSAYYASLAGASLTPGVPGAVAGAGVAAGAAVTNPYDYYAAYNAAYYNYYAAAGYGAPAYYPYDAYASAATTIPTTTTATTTGVPGYPPQYPSDATNNPGNNPT